MTRNEFGHDTTTDEVLEGVDLSGQRILVTGASTGLGQETARALSAHGADVVMTARTAERGKAALEAVRAAAAPGASVELAEVDLASLASVRACTARLLADGRPLNVLIANAGVMACPQGTTTDGFETQFGTNHLGHFAFVNELVPLLVDSAPARIVLLSSHGHRFSDVDLDDPHFERTEYDPLIAYGRSKTANVLFAVELDRRLRDRGVRATALHPGMIMTDLGRHMTEEIIGSLRRHPRPEGEARVGFKPIPAGAATSVWAAAVADPAATGGRYLSDCNVQDVRRPDEPGEGVLAYAVDPDTARALWAKSEELVGRAYPPG